MGIDFNISINRKITVNGKEYGSLEEVPAEHRKNLQGALNSAGGGNPGRIMINGVGYNKPEDMPPEARRIYDEALGKAKAMAREKGLDLADFGIKQEPGIQFKLGLQSGAPVQEGSLSPRIIIILLIAVAVALLVKFSSLF